MRGLSVLAFVALVACKPNTPEERFRKVLRSGSVDDVTTALDAGRAAGGAFEDGQTPLHVVAGSVHRSSALAKLLIDRGADVGAQTPEGLTAWDTVWGEPDAVVDASGAELMLVLLDAGATPSDVTTPSGESRLHVAARKADSERLMTVLITEHGGDVKAVDANGWTPLHAAVHANHPASAKGLVDAKADPNAETTKTVEGASWRYEAGSRPLDVVRHESRIQRVDAVREVLETAGGTSNAAVKNQAR